MERRTLREFQALEKHWRFGLWAHDLIGARTAGAFAGKRPEELLYFPRPEKQLTKEEFLERARAGGSWQHISRVLQTVVDGEEPGAVKTREPLNHTNG